MRVQEHAPQQGKTLERIEQVAHRIQLGRSWIWGAVKRGEFPAPKKLSARCTRWVSSDIDKWIDERLQNGSLK